MNDKKDEDDTIDIPKELEILNPEWQAKPILIGRKVYTLYPLTEGQAEKLSKTINEIIYNIYTTDMRCPKCGKVYKDSLGKLFVCAKKGCEEEPLEELQMDAIAAILDGGRLKRIIAELFSIPEVEVRRATIPQLRYIAGLLYLQNFSEDSAPKDSEKNFQGLLNWMGIGVEARESAPSEQSTNTLQKNMDLPENISKENGKAEDS